MGIEMMLQQLAGGKPKAKTTEGNVFASDIDGSYKTLVALQEIAQITVKTRKDLLKLDKTTLLVGYLAGLYGAHSRSMRAVDERLAFEVGYILQAIAPEAVSLGSNVEDIALEILNSGEAVKTFSEDVENRMNHYDEPESKKA